MQLRKFQNMISYQKDGIIILETDTNEEVPDEIGIFEKYNYKRYGRNILNLFRRKG